MKIVVRLSTPEDMPQVLRLIKDLATFEKEINDLDLLYQSILHKTSDKSLFSSIDSIASNLILSVFVFVTSQSCF